MNYPWLLPTWHLFPSAPNQLSMKFDSLEDRGSDQLVLYAVFIGKLGSDLSTQLHSTHSQLKWVEMSCKRAPLNKVGSISSALQLWIICLIQYDSLETICQMRLSVPVVYFLFSLILLIVYPVLKHLLHKIIQSLLAEPSAFIHAHPTSQNYRLLLTHRP